MSKSYRTIVVALLLSVIATAAFAANVDTPAIATGVNGHAKATLTITAGPSGLPNGFTVWWMDQATFIANGGTWPSQETSEMGAAAFTGAPTLNTFGGQYTTFKLAPNQSIRIEIGDLFQETGVEGDTGELNYASRYYFTAFGLDEFGAKSSEFSVTVNSSTTSSTNCTYTIGYWKNHTELWPVTNLTLGTVNYSAAQLLSILNQSVEGNGLVSLAHQLIGALLNIANGADPSAAQATIDAANALIDGLVVPPVGGGFLAPATTSALTQTLDDYNNGLIGPGHCGSVPARQETWGGIKALYR